MDLAVGSDLRSAVGSDLGAAVRLDLNSDVRLDEMTLRQKSLDK